MIADGMDQSKSNLPHFAGWRMMKGIEPQGLCKTHITGVMMHGKNTLSVVDLFSVPHDSNLTLNSVTESIMRNYPDRSMPETLFIQFDNCWRDNKNRFVFGFLSMMVALSIVKVVEISFLMVGHTHEDIDGIFGNIAQILMKYNALHLLALMERIKQSLKDGSVHPCLLTKVYDYKKWMKPYLNMNLKYFTKHHRFRHVKFLSNV